MMRIQFTPRKFNSAELEGLIDKYYEGCTTSQDERRLCELLASPSLPPCFEADRAILNYFGKQKAAKSSFSVPYRRPVYRRYAAVAAVFLMVVVGVKWASATASESYAYIDGKKVTDIKVIRSQALASLNSVANAPDEVQESVKNLKTNDLIQQQLDAFQELSQ